MIIIMLQEMAVVTQVVKLSSIGHALQQMILYVLLYVSIILILQESSVMMVISSQEMAAMTYALLSLDGLALPH